MSSRAQRGQSAVELALASLIFVTILIFGIHFSEVGFLSLKVEEAANAALWDTTAQKMHDTFAPDWTLYQGAVNNAGSSATSRYQDYDGRTSQNGTGNISEVFTTGEPIQVTCQEAGLASVQVLPPATSAVPSNSASMKCQAQAKLYGTRIPEHFLDSSSGALFEVVHWTRVDIEACSSGRPTGGGCNGQYATLLDDWGFSGDQEAQQCPVQDGSGCANSGYYGLVQSIFWANGGAQGIAATNMALQIVGIPAPYSENSFSMSFRGSESTFKDTLADSHGDSSWETTPYSNPSDYQSSYQNRSQCFLGLSCN